MTNFELMLAMQWSYPDLLATPLYVRRYCWEFLQLRGKQG